MRLRPRVAISSWVAALVLLPSGCAGGPELCVLRHDNGVLARRGLLVNGLQNGEWEFFYPNGRLESVGSYRDDIRDGCWRYWHENGSRSMAGRWEHERQWGPWEFWHGNDQQRCRGNYLDGREHGEWSFFHDDGRLQQQGCFAVGKRTLWWTEWDRAGATAMAGCYLDDQRVGVWSRGAAGALIEYPTPPGYRHVRETWDDGSPRREGFLRDGRREGLWVSRHRGGGLRLCATFANDRLAGPVIAQAGNGALLAIGEVVDGRLQGRWRVWDQHGERTLELGGRPRLPPDGSWSDVAVAEREDALQVADRWLAELEGPLDVAAAPDAVTRAAAPASPAPAELPAERPEAPTDPGWFTVAELRRLPELIEYYVKGRLPRRAPDLGYAVRPHDRRLGAGDPELARRLVGRRLPVTGFRAADGSPFDLDSLRGRRVLLVVLRGYTAQVCLYCFAQVSALERFTGQLAGLQCELVVMFPGSRSKMQAFQVACAQQFADAPAPYRIVYDPDLSLAVALGLEGNLVRPTSLILDRDGVVRHAYVAESADNVMDRPAAEHLVDLVAGLADERQ